MNINVFSSCIPIHLNLSIYQTALGLFWLGKKKYNKKKLQIPDSIKPWFHDKKYMFFENVKNGVIGFCKESLHIYKLIHTLQIIQNIESFF